MFLRAFAIWFVLLITAVLNGAFREAWITPRLGRGAGHVISTVTLSTAIMFAAWTSISWIGARSTADALVVGATWLALTVAFEFVAGHYLFRKRWEELFADYSIVEGRIWIVVLLATLLAPVWAVWQGTAAVSVSFFSAFILLALALACAMAVRQLARTARVWHRVKGPRLVTCTATGRSAAIRINLPYAVATALTSPNPEIRIADCSLWATGEPCDQGCINEALAPDSAVRRIVARWYEKKVCVYCAKPITAQSFGHRAALRNSQGMTREWSEVPADGLLDSLSADLPVCWNCHVAETLRRERPDLITDRPWPKNPARRAG